MFVCFPNQSPRLVVLHCALQTVFRETSPESVHGPLDPPPARACPQAVHWAQETNGASAVPSTYFPVVAELHTSHQFMSYSPKPPVPQNVTLFGKGVTVDVTS